MNKRAQTRGQGRGEVAQAGRAGMVQTKVSGTELARAGGERRRLGQGGEREAVTPCP